MKCNLGSEVLLRAKTLGKDNFATTDSLQGCHHLLPTPKPWDTRQTKVMCRLDTMSTLTATTLALARNFYLYQESSTRVSVTRLDDKPTSK
jgi:hypothetical protein